MEEHEEFPHHIPNTCHNSHTLSLSISFHRYFTSLHSVLSLNCTKMAQFFWAERRLAMAFSESTTLSGGGLEFVATRQAQSYFGGWIYLSCQDGSNLIIT
ncbi:hypothetical protein MIMGU_mgv1a016959mg [Erythranthe guttata]|uniref:Uncharacterized protein n=1 Tax=Erythranthe guttata TaxID=4155 RepID=A0A022PSL7_ERYGU|nr:hypothetical protein MIMGU_mgv1a016959mg [Erythranthe guttata]